MSTNTTSSQATPGADNFRYFASAPRGLVDLLAEELSGLGAQNLSLSGGGVRFQGPLHTAYEACMHSHLANRIVISIHKAPASDASGLYSATSEVLWRDHLNPSDSFSIAFSSHRTWLRDSRFGAQTIKDALVDQFRAAIGSRPDVDRANPAVRIHAHLRGDELELSIELCTEQLFRRGQERLNVPAPLKENVAAAVLMRARWPELAQQGATLLDPMCGSGTLLLEGWSMATDLAPGLRSARALSAWRGHDQGLWAATIDNARERAQRGADSANLVALGCDSSSTAVENANEAIRTLGLEGRISISQRPIKQLQRPDAALGLLVVNPPYGTRLFAGREHELEALYQDFGDVLRQRFQGWKAAILCADEAPASAMRLAQTRRYRLYNGPIACTLHCAELAPAGERKTRQATNSNDQSAQLEEIESLQRATEFGNRLRKNVRRLSRWSRRAGVSCYRIYDADLPDYALAIDLYQGEQLFVHAQEYAPPAEVPAQKARQRFNDAIAAISNVLEVPSARIVRKQRKRQRGSAQYERLDQKERLLEVREDGARLLVNLHDYLDTGLFLDHRPVRSLIRRESSAQKFLNLFAYTGAASVAALLGGAVHTDSIDTSRRYCDWARRNLDLNAADPRAHHIYLADCNQWLAQQYSNQTSMRYDLILIDPPTFSNSKSRQTDFEVQRDHESLIQLTSKLLAPGGSMLFSCNKRRFQLASSLQQQFDIEDISKATIAEDFARSPRIHQCFRLRDKH